jgi:2-haloacid dehalogenase
MAETWRPKAIIFDLLTALLDSWSTWDAATTSSGHDTALGYTWRKRYLELTFACGAYRPYEDLTMQAARDVGLSDKAVEKLLEIWGALQPWPEIVGVLEKLRGKGYKLGVVTNCSKGLGARAAKKVKLEGWWDAVVTAEDAGYGF